MSGVFERGWASSHPSPVVKLNQSYKPKQVIGTLKKKPTLIETCIFAIALAITLYFENERQ